MLFKDFGKYGLWVLIFCFSVTLSNTAVAQCSDDEMTAVFVVSGIVPGGDMYLEHLKLYKVGQYSYPSDDQMLANASAVHPGLYQKLETVSQLHHFYETPNNDGGVSLVDGRNGKVVFAGTTVWNGVGEILYPLHSTTEWTWLQNHHEVATPPDYLGVIQNPSWVNNRLWDNYFGNEKNITARTLTYLRQIDVLQSFGHCGEYSAVSYVFTPTDGDRYPEEVSCVIVVNGFCAAPFNGEIVPVIEATWDGVKSLYR